MILSMTGFGAADRQVERVAYRVEIRSVNNRYFKLAVKLPDLLAGLEPEIERSLRKRMGRGSVTFLLRVRDESPSAAYEVNVAALQAYVDRIRDVRPDGGPLTIDMAALLALPGVCQPPQVDESTLGKHREAIFAALDEAVVQLLGMRREEGAALRADLLAHLDRMRQLIEGLRGRAPLVVEDYHKKLRARVNALLAKAELQLAQDDLMREVAVFAERCDIHEELSRLASHVDQCAKLCDGSEEAGRKLDFLAQEMLREANTIGSKANDVDIARLVVEAKAVIDRIKEQVQNVE